MVELKVKPPATMVELGSKNANQRNKEKKNLIDLFLLFMQITTYVYSCASPVKHCNIYIYIYRPHISRPFTGSLLEIDVSQQDFTTFSQSGGAVSQLTK